MYINEVPNVNVEHAYDDMTIDYCFWQLTCEYDLCNLSIPC
jgi:hypothetical protein